MLVSAVVFLVKIYVQCGLVDAVLLLYRFFIRFHKIEPVKDAIGQDEARKELKLCRCVVFHTSKVRSFDTQTYLQVYVYVTLCHGSLQVSLVGSVENLDGEAIVDRPNANVTRSLQGQVAGLNIVQTDGKATHSGSIYIRGNGTSYNTRKNFSSSAAGSSHSIGSQGSALVLIDGVEGSLSQVNPADIETVAVLKDASSAAIYGARAAYGVILVTTKNADTDKITVSYNGSFSLNSRIVKWEDNIVTDGLEWTESFYENVW